MSRKILTLICSLGLLFSFNHNANATHLYGGDLSYAYIKDTLGGTQHIYEITLTLYQDCNSQFWLTAFPQRTVAINIFEAPLNAKTLTQNSAISPIQIPLVDSVQLKSNMPPGCAISAGSCIYKTVYKGRTSLPTSFIGYHFIYDRCCRTDAVTNVDVPVNSQTDGTLLQSWTASTSTRNSSPKFQDFDFPFMCIGKMNTVLNLAQDPDGNLLNYSLYRPFDGRAQNGDYSGSYPTFPPAEVNYRDTNFTAQKPMGLNGTLNLDGLTGFTTMSANISGDYVVGIKVTEIDKRGQTVGIVHREYQFPFQACNDSNTTFPTLVTSKSDYEIDAGDTLCFDIEYEDKGGSPLNYLYRVQGLIFDTSFTKPNATLGTPSFSPGKSKQEFCWPTNCEQGRPTKYFFTASVADSACAPNVTNTVFSVLVKPAETPSVINGANSLCAGAANEEYTTDTIPGLTYNWEINGGAFLTGTNGPGVRVNWGNGPGGNLKVSGVNPNGCKGDTIDLAVFVATFPINPGKDTSICIGDTVTLGGDATSPTAPVGSSIKWIPGAGLSNDTVANPRAFPNQTTRYLLSVTDSTGQCTVVDTVLVTIGVNPNASAGNDTTLCQGNQTTLNGSGGATYNWTPGNLLNDSTIANPVTNITSDQTFIVRIDLPGTCTTFDTVVVTIDEQGDLNPGADSSICEGLTHPLGGNPTGVPNARYLWTPSANLSNDTIPNPIFTPTGTGITKFFVTMTTPANCVFSDSVEITVDTIPTVDILFGKDSICRGDTTFIQAIGGNNFAWNDTSLKGGGPHIIRPQSDTIYMVTVTDANFCSASDTQRFVVKDIPEITIPFDTIFLCNQDTMTITTTPGTGATAWTPNYNILPDTTASEPRVFPRTDTTYFVQFTNYNGCNATDSIRIEVAGEVPTEAGPDFTLCSPDTVMLGQGASTPVFNTSFNWTPAGSLTNSSVRNPMTFADTTTQYFLNTTNGNCTGRDSVLVTVKNRPTITFTQNPYQICENDTVQIDTLNSTGFIVTIAVFPTPTNVVGGTGINLRLAPDSSVSYNVVLADSNGCIDTSALSIIVQDPPNVKASSDSAKCAGTPFQLIASGASTYSWSPANLLDKPNTQFPVAVADTTTEFILTGTTQAGCSANDTLLVTVFPTPKVDAGGQFVVCSDTVNTIRLGGSPTGDASTRYVWSPITDLDNPNTANPICTFTLPRTYIVLGVDTNGCTNSDTADIRLYSFKINNVTAECSGDSIQLNLYDTFGTAPFSYQWIPSTGLSDSTIANPKTSVQESTTYKIVMRDSVGCVDSNTVDVVVKEQVKADFNLLIQADCENTTVTAINNSENVTEYQWFLNGDYISGEESPQFTFPYNSQFSVSLITLSADSCVARVDSSMTSLNFEDYFTGEVPNVFTPNGDGINDLFDFRLGNRLEQCSFISIYNRWGTLVYESRENAHIWDGRTFTGEECSQGQYFYILEVNGTTYKGSLTLIRE